MLAVAVLAIATGFVAVGSLLQRRSPQQFITHLFIESPQEHFHKDHLAVLLVGLDYNYTASDIENSQHARTDTIKAIEMNFPTQANPSGSIAIVSVPRDMDVTMPNGREDRINSAYEDGGIRNSEAVIAKFLGVPGFDRYITLRIDAAKSLIDAIGGIDVVPDETMNYDDHWGHLSIHFVAGKKYHMNGEQAVSYSRFRHDACGDPCRIRRQDQVMRITIAKLKNDRFNDIAHISALIDVLRKNVDTNLSTREALSIANAFSQIDQKQIAMSQVPYVTDKDLPNVGNVIVADEDAKRRIVAKFLTPPVATDAPVDPAAVAAIVPSSVRVAVENGSGVSGAASKIAADLRAKGFVVVAVSDADRFGYTASQIRVRGNGETPAGERVRTALGLPAGTVGVAASDAATPAQIADSGSSGPRLAAEAKSDVTVVVGDDLDAPQTEASAVR